MGNDYVIKKKKRKKEKKKHVHAIFRCEPWIRVLIHGERLCNVYHQESSNTCKQRPEQTI